jgi:hypothetical protein
MMQGPMMNDITPTLLTGAHDLAAELCPNKSDIAAHLYALFSPDFAIPRPAFEPNLGRQRRHHRPEWTHSMSNQQPIEKRNHADEFRDYFETIRPAAAPRAALNDLQLVSSTVRLLWLRTRHPLDVVMQPGYFNNVAELRLKKEDRIEVVADCNGEGRADHATIVVDHVNKHGGDVRVSVLQRFERSPKAMPQPA